jgi:hypothetical protein
MTWTGPKGEERDRMRDDAVELYTVKKLGMKEIGKIFLLKYGIGSYGFINILLKEAKVEKRGRGGDPRRWARMKE